MVRPKDAHHHLVGHPSVPILAWPGAGRPGGTEGRGAVPAIAALIVQVELDHGSPERYTLALAYTTGNEAEEMKKWHGEAIVADLRSGDEATACSSTPSTPTSS